MLIKYTQKEAQVYQKLRNDVLITMDDVSYVLDVDPVLASKFVLRMGLPVYRLVGRRGYLVFSSDLVKAVTKCRVNDLPRFGHLLVRAADRKLSRLGLAFGKRPQVGPKRRRRESADADAGNHRQASSGGSAGNPG